MFAATLCEGLLQFVMNSVALYIFIFKNFFVISIDSGINKSCFQQQWNSVKLLTVKSVFWFCELTKLLLCSYVETGKL